MSKDTLPASLIPVLEAWEMHAEPQEGGSIRLYDLDGSYRTTVSASISEYDLVALLRYGLRCHKEGEALGAINVKHALRQLIGAAPLEV